MSTHDPGDALPPSETDVSPEALPPPEEPRGGAKDARMWASFCHLAGLTICIGIPGIIGTLIVWLIKRDADPFIDREGKEAVNFQLTALVLKFAFVVGTFMTCGFGAILVVPLAFVLLICLVVFPILGTIAASEGRSFRYPCTIRFLT